MQAKNRKFVLKPRATTRHRTSMSFYETDTPIRAIYPAEKKSKSNYVQKLKSSTDIGPKTVDSPTNTDEKKQENEQ